MGVQKCAKSSFSMQLLLENIYITYVACFFPSCIVFFWNWDRGSLLLQDSFLVNTPNFAYCNFSSKLMINWSSTLSKFKKLFWQLRFLKHKLIVTRKTPGFAQLCSSLRFRFVRVPRPFLRNLFCLDFMDGSVNNWHWQVGITPATSNSKHGRALCYKTFLTENPGFLPGFRIFPEFFCTMLLRVISGFRKTEVYKILLRIVGGDSKQRNLCSNTQRLHNLILIGLFLPKVEGKMKWIFPQKSDGQTGIF